MSGLYIHIPFCSRRCNYCDFYLITNFNVIDKFLVSLKREIELISSSVCNEVFDTISFGGGTPSVLSALQINDLLEHLHKNFIINSNPEISLEANPEDFLLKSTLDYKEAGINRLSFGVQSFIDSELKFLTRNHSAANSESVILNASQYFENISVDIIYSLPGQTVDEINFSLSKALQLNVKHLSAYTLTYEERTPLFKSWKNKVVGKNSEDTEAQMYKFVADKLLSEGFVHYEVSNFAIKDYQSKHNLKYWNYENYIGLGPSSHSMHNGVRWSNYRDIVKYISMLSENQLPVGERYEVEPVQMKLELTMLGLRSSGIYFSQFKKITGEDFKALYSRSIEELICNDFAAADDEKFYLSERGYALADEIVAKYF